MFRYVIKRFLITIPVIIGVSIIIFTILYFTPGDPGSIILGPTATPEEIAAKNEALGINRPYIVRLGEFLYKTFIKFDLGTSYITSKTVIADLKDRFPYTCALAFYGMFVSAIVGIPLGVISAVHQDKFADKFIRVFSIIMNCMPGFWVALLLVLVFSLKLNLLPSYGIGTWKHWVIPCMSMFLTGFAGIARQTRSSMLEVIRSDYVVTARAQGYSEKDVIYKHALPNALIPVVTMLGGHLAGSMGGTLILETVFSIPGIGISIQNGINNRDYPVVQGSVVFLAVLFCFIMALVDILYAVIDPRIKAQYEAKNKKINLKIKRKESSI